MLSHSMSSLAPHMWQRLQPRNIRGLKSGQVNAHMNSALVLCALVDLGGQSTHLAEALQGLVE